MIDARGRLRDLSAELMADIAGTALLRDLLKRLRPLDADALPLVEGAPRLRPCVAAFGKIIAVGLNYSDDVRVSNMPIPSEPTLFLQAASAITDSSHDVEIPLGAQKTDWEVELSVVVGKRGNYVKLERALEYVAGYCIVNNLSECSNELEHGGFAGLGVQQQHAVPPKST